ncbi:twin-arginine translocase TatA/TatE family subunit [Rhodocytophaga aerolata]|uniref:Sec-independent protein translocase protein TatA n=1 Tax=Rhodocytophaga aerolata TaxID=455078 RepID=A0ABT8RIX0_9BACT|nr:twin-arginine translocase TatA/TatE family subunit [Rhodocytophaga aerolata]MDO1451123.1 twin-arginine translocase TatA/TatE family subunit [Rhodocytophaga aerolata]
MSLTTIFAFLGNLGGPEIILIVLFVLIFFGAKKIPELARGLGRGIKEFQSATKDIKNDMQESVKEDKPVVKTEVENPENSQATKQDNIN